MRFDIVSFIVDHSIPYDMRVNPGWINVQCPWCPDHSKNGGWNIAGSYFHCWRCGGHGDVATVAKMLRVSRERAEDEISPYEGRTGLLKKINKKEAKQKSIDFPFSELSKRDRKYLKKRHFDPDFLAEKYKIASGGITGHWAYRIMIPFYLDGKLVTYQGRDTTGIPKNRYDNLPIEDSVVNPKHLLYNLDNCKGTHAYVMEGVTDVWRFGDGFIATMGTSLDPAQIRLMAKRYKSITFLFDPEIEAQSKAKKHASLLASLGRAVEIIDLELDHDPGDCTEEEVISIKKELGIL